MMSQPLLTLEDLTSKSISLTDTLNILLAKLHLPFVLETPADLTPSLLLGILECILESRLPIPISIRESRSKSAKVEAMKIFLGVLENDIIQRDVGLSNVDPRNLAASEWDEVVFVAELLCWLGKKSGIITADDVAGVEQTHSIVGSNENKEELEDVFGKALDNTASSSRSLGHHAIRAQSPSTRSSLTDSAHTALFMANGATQDSDTSISTMSPDETRHTSPPLTPRLQYHTDDSLLFRRHRPQCIHELEDETFIPRALQDSNLDETTELESEAGSMSSVPIRYDGWLEKVDTDVEIESFETRRRERRSLDQSKAQRYFSLERSTTDRNFSVPSTSTAAPSRLSHFHGSDGVITRHTSPTGHTLALMNERARLLAQLAGVDCGRATSPPL